MESIRDYVDKILEGADIADTLMDGIEITPAAGDSPVEEPVSSDEAEVCDESFAIGNYIKFLNGNDGYFARDQKDDIHLIFEPPMDGLVGRLNSTTTFKLIGYDGDTAKIVAMVNDNMNGNKSGEVYFVNKAELLSKAKSVMPRKNKLMNGKYPA